MNTAARNALTLALTALTTVAGSRTIAAQAQAVTYVFRQEQGTFPPPNDCIAGPITSSTIAIASTSCALTKNVGSGSGLASAEVLSREL